MTAAANALPGSSKDASAGPWRASTSDTLGGERARGRTSDAAAAALILQQWFDEEYDAMLELDAEAI